MFSFSLVSGLPNRSFVVVIPNVVFVVFLMHHFKYIFFSVSLNWNLFSNFVGDKHISYLLSLDAIV